MADVKCFCTAAFCGHEGQRCGKRVEFEVETQAYQGEGKYGPFLRIGLCDECFRNIEAQVPFLIGDDR